MSLRCSVYPAGGAQLPFACATSAIAIPFARAAPIPILFSLRKLSLSFPMSRCREPLATKEFLVYTSPSLQDPCASLSPSTAM
jgi:hypothetical protein